MSLPKGTIHQQVVSDNNPAFSLDGMVKPTFQNVGCPVMLGDWLLNTGDSFPVDMPFQLVGYISITFTLETDRNLRVSFGRLSQ